MKELELTIYFTLPQYYAIPACAGMTRPNNCEGKDCFVPRNDETIPDLLFHFFSYLHHSPKPAANDNTQILPFYLKKPIYTIST
jgi:hypothetical protein